MKKLMSFAIEPELIKELKKYSKLIGVSSSAFIRMAIIEKIKRVSK